MSADVKKKLPLRSLRIIEENPKAMNTNGDKTENTVNEGENNAENS